MKVEGLTEEQRQIVEASGDLLVIAGPGSGKTRTLLYKAKRLLLSGVPEEKILVLSFSVKISLELRKKLMQIGVPKIKVDTFHGFAYDLLSAESKKPLKVITEEEKKDILKKLFPKAKDPLLNFENRTLYQAFLEKNDLYDFDFLIYKSSKIQKRDYRGYFLIVDEFQDLTPELFPLLANLRDATWIFFGDPNQSIYGFRGVILAELKVFLDRIKPGLRTFYLTRSFRCPEMILNYAEKFKTSPWHVPRAVSQIPEGLLRGYISSEEWLELEKLTKLVKECLGGITLEESKTNQVAPEEILILSRINSILKPVRHHLLQEGIPTGLPEDRAKELYLELVELLRFPNLRQLSFPQILDRVSPELKVILKNLYELFNEDKDKFLAYLASLKEEDLILPETQGVNLMTIHASKGLEAKVVILVGAEDGILPLTIFRAYDVDEEKRLLYVALTRSKERFYFFCQKGRRVYGRILEDLSPFFRDFPVKELKKTKAKVRQTTLF